MIPLMLVRSFHLGFEGAHDQPLSYTYPALVFVYLFIYIILTSIILFTSFRLQDIARSLARSG